MLKRKLQQCYKSLEMLKQFYRLHGILDVKEIEDLQKDIESIPKLTIKKPELVKSEVEKIVAKSIELMERIDKNYFGSFIMKVKEIEEKNND